MKIAVCVKHVPDGRLRIDPGSQRLDRSSAGELNRVDTNAVEEALQLRESTEGEVVVLAMGPDPAVESLRTALALGADRAMLISDPAVAGSDLVATSRVLAAALQREDPELILFGQQTIDGGGAMLWAAVADRLRRPVISQAAELSVTDGVVRVVRQSEFGDDVIEAPLPAVVAVSDAINEPRYASLRGMMGAKRKPLETLSLADLGMDASDAGDAGSGTEVLSHADPPTRTGTVRIEDEGDAAQAIIDYLATKQLI